MFRKSSWGPSEVSLSTLAPNSIILQLMHTLSAWSLCPATHGEGPKGAWGGGGEHAGTLLS